VARELGIEDQVSFGESFTKIREAVNDRNTWKARFDAADVAKA
jgi:hypothetical protein